MSENETQTPSRETILAALTQCKAAMSKDRRVFRAGDGYSQCGTTRSDRNLTTLGMLYLDANEEQKAFIHDQFSDSDTWELLMYIRRAGARLHANDLRELVRPALAIACIENGRFDPRDLIVSLLILRYGIESTGTSHKPYFDDIVPIAGRKTRTILRNARNQSRSALLETVRQFGPEKWRNVTVEFDIDREMKRSG